MKVGDKVYYQFEPWTIEKIEEGIIKELKSPFGVLGGYFSEGLDIFEDSPETEKESEYVKSCYQQIRDNAKTQNINYPDIREKLSKYWIKLITAEFLEDSIESTELIQNFTDGIIILLNRRETVHGVTILVR